MYAIQNKQSPIEKQQNIKQSLCKSELSLQTIEIKKQKNNLKKHRTKPFSITEDKLLLLQISRLGKRFSAIAKEFPKRTIHELKNRYYTALRGKENHIFDSNSIYFLPDKLDQMNEKKNQVKGVSYLQLAISLEECLISGSQKEILKKLIANLKRIFTQLIQLRC